jgi:hypothetical protein
MIIIGRGIYFQKVIFYTSFAARCAVVPMALLNLWIIHSTFTQQERTFEVFAAMFVALGIVIAIYSLFVGICNFILYKTQVQEDALKNFVAMHVGNEDQETKEEKDEAAM